MNGYGTFDKYENYIIDMINKELNQKQLNKKEIIACILGITIIVIQIINNVIAMYTKIKSAEYDIPMLIEIICKIIGIFSFVQLLREKIKSKKNVSIDETQIPSVSHIINHPQYFTYNDIPNNSVMNAQQCLQGFAMVAESINNANKTTLRAIERIETRMDKMNERMDKMDERMGRIETRMDRIETRMDKMDERMGRIETRMDKMDERMDRMETKMDAGFANIIELLQKK